MANKIIDKLLKLNHQGKSLREISKIVALSYQQVWTLIHNDKKYIPGKRGFARMSKERMKEVSSQGGKKANELGVTYRWNTKTAKAASKKSLLKRSKQA